MTATSSRAQGALAHGHRGTPRAEHYRVEKQTGGVDADFVHELTRDESDATLTGVPSGKTLRLRVVAVNDAGPSAPSAVAGIVVP